jgi:TetR/AcrR family transcriptional regulator, tetracycline repressor protein
VATALQIAEKDGAGALSMRTLAQRLDSGTATLYRHFPNRAALVAAVVDHVLGEVEVALSKDQLTAMGWHDACRALGQAMFNSLARHRNLAPLLAEQIPAGPNARALRESCIAVLLDGGFPPPVAARAFATLSRYVVGIAIQAGSRSATAGPGEREDEGDGRSPAFRDLDPSSYPATVAAAGSLPVPIGEEFSFGLELILNGLAQLRDHT